MSAPPWLDRSFTTITGGTGESLLYTDGNNVFKVFKTKIDRDHEFEQLKPFAEMDLMPKNAALLSEYDGRAGYAYSLKHERSFLSWITPKRSAGSVHTMLQDLLNATEEAGLTHGDAVLANICVADDTNTPKAVWIDFRFSSKTPTSLDRQLLSLEFSSILNLRSKLAQHINRSGNFNEKKALEVYNALHHILPKADRKNTPSLQELHWKKTYCKYLISRSTATVKLTNPDICPPPIIPPPIIPPPIIPLPEIAEPPRKKAGAARGLPQCWATESKIQ